MPPNTLIVDRRTRWGNPTTLEIVRGMWDDRYGPLTDEAARRIAVDAFRRDVLAGEEFVPSVAEIRAELAGWNLACWCPPAHPCHVDVYLPIANGAEL
jgi:hypothetical protein